MTPDNQATNSPRPTSAVPPVTPKRPRTAQVLPEQRILLTYINDCVRGARILEARDERLTHFAFDVALRASTKARAAGAALGPEFDSGLALWILTHTYLQPGPVTRTSLRFALWVAAGLGLAARPRDLADAGFAPSETMLSTKAIEVTGERFANWQRSIVGELGRSTVSGPRDALIYSLLHQMASQAPVVGSNSSGGHRLGAQIQSISWQLRRRGFALGAEDVDSELGCSAFDRGGAIHRFMAVRGGALVLDERRCRDLLERKRHRPTGAQTTRRPISQPTHGSTSVAGPTRGPLRMTPGLGEPALAGVADCEERSVVESVELTELRHACEALRERFQGDPAALAAIDARSGLRTQKESARHWGVTRDQLRWAWNRHVLPRAQAQLGRFAAS